MSRVPYYQYLKELANNVRSDFNLTSPRVLRSDLRRVYKFYGIQIDIWPYKLKNLRGAYFNDEMGVSVMLAKGLPPEPTVFTMAHELKHHLTDQGLKVSYCGLKNAREEIEIGAEIFAAELIFPDQDFIQTMEDMGVVKGKCDATDIVKLKDFTKTTLSYASLSKKAEFFGFASPKVFANTRWKMLEEKILGIPIYKKINQRR